MAKRQIVITGIGVICSNGIGKDAFAKAIFEGVSGIKPVSLFDASGYSAKTAGEARDFDPQQILGAKGLRTLDRTTKLAVSAAKLALDDAGLEVNEENSRSIAVVLGATLGSVNSVCQFDKEALKEGPRYVNPALFPNTVINSPASQISIRFNIRGSNTTIATGSAAGLDALGYAAGLLNNGRAKIVLAGATEEFCLETFLGFYKAGLLAGGGGAPEVSCPYDRRRNGVILGEGACILVLEDLESAASRKAKIYAGLSGYGMGFDAGAQDRDLLGGAGLVRAMQTAAEVAGIGADGPDYICAAANSSVALDAAETAAIKKVFQESAKKVPASAIKSMTGECYSASGSLQAAAAALAIKEQVIPPTINYAQPDPRCDLNYVVNKAKSCKIDNVLINAFCPAGSAASLALSRWVE